MTRALLLLAIAAWQLAAVQSAYCRSPDQVPRSPVPPIEAPRQNNVPGSSGQLGQPPGTIDAIRKPETNPGAGGAYTGAPVASPAELSKERAQLWNSPEMQAAREAVMDFCRRSAQTSPAEGEKFLERLSQLSPEKMRDWLERFQARRANSVRGREAEQLARQLKLENAIRQQETGRQAAANAAELRQQALSAPPRPLRQQVTNYPPMKGAPPFGSTLSFDPFEPSFDPMSPRGYRRRVAAAMSLPGDLPRDDPRNFIRGEEGIDFGNGANRGAPPVPVSPPPAAQ